MPAASMRTVLSKTARVAGIKHAARTAVAVVLTQLVVTLLGLPQGYWAVITVVIVMQTNIGGSLQAGWARLAGTGVGAITGATANFLGGNSYLSLGLAILVTLSICTFIRQLRNSMRVAGITVVIVLLSGHSGDSPTMIALTRFSEIAVGIIMAIIVSATFFPSRASRAISRGMAKVFEDASSLFVLVVEGRLLEEYPAASTFALKDSIVRTLARCKDLCQEADMEDRGFDAARRNLLLYRGERLFEYVLGMDHVASEDRGGGLHRHLPTELSNLKIALGTVLTGLAEHLRNGAALPQAEQLETAVRSAREKLDSLRHDAIQESYDLSEIMHFYSFMHGMMACASETLEVSRRLAVLDK